MKTGILKQIFISLILSVFLACGGGGGSSTGGGDSDGIDSAVETAGWDIILDRNGNGDYETVHVTSDPDEDDSDGDGLGDAVEKDESLTDPMAADSDGDGLSDYDEIYLHASSPISVDSDGDSRGDDPDHPLTSNELLHDGSEVNVYHSSPGMADTDGDGLSDYYEIVESGIFHPAVADLPEVAIEINPDSLPKVALEGSHTSIQNWGKEFSVTDTLQRTVNYTKAGTSSTEITHNAHIKVGGELGGKFGAKDAGVSWKVTGEVGYAFTHAHTNEVSWSSARSISAQEEYQNIRSQSESEELTVTGGTITTGLTVKNTGDITFDLTDLSISVRVREPYGLGRFTEVMPLFQPGGFNSVTLSPLVPETGALLFEGSSTDVNLMMALIRDPSALKFEVGSFNLVDEFGHDFAYTEQNVAAKTAAIFIDYGGNLDPERYLVATNFTRDAEGEFMGITLGEALSDILEIDFATADIPNGDNGTFKGLARVRTVERDTDNRYVWLVATTSESMDQDDPPDFENIVLKASDRVHLIFVRDKDDDGLAAREEFLFGTSDDETDSDGDGLSDYEELVTGWRVPYAGKDIYSDPTRADDYDGDGLTDDEERDNQSDPFTPDTDEDGLYDGDDPYPNEPDGSVEGFRASTLSSSEIQLDWTPPTDSDSFGGVLILRQDSGMITDRPEDGQTYTVGETIGVAQVVYVGSGNTNSDTGLSDETEYFYRLFARYDFAAPAVSPLYTAGVSRSTSTAYQVENVYNLAAGSISDKALTLTWANPARAEFRGVVIGKMDGGTVVDMDGIELTDGQSYYVGDRLPNGSGKELNIVHIIDDATITEFTELDLAFHSRYGYKLFSFDTAAPANYSSGTAVSAETQWGTTRIQLEVFELTGINVNEGWAGSIVCPWCVDLSAELLRKVVFKVKGKDATGKVVEYVNEAVYNLPACNFLYANCRFGSNSVAAINVDKTYTQEFGRDAWIEVDLWLKNATDLVPIWEAVHEKTQTVKKNLADFAQYSGLIQTIFFEMPTVKAKLRFRITEVP
jgi:hypothetical protein